ncbi:hypothetical protein ACFX2C_013822 [Malus domestica]
MIWRKLERHIDVDNVTTVFKHPGVRMSFSYNMDDEYKKLIQRIHQGICKNHTLGSYRSMNFLLGYNFDAIIYIMVCKISYGFYLPGGQRLMSLWRS